MLGVPLGPIDYFGIMLPARCSLFLTRLPIGPECVLRMLRVPTGPIDYFVRMQSMGPVGTLRNCKVHSDPIGCLVKKRLYFASA